MHTLNHQEPLSPSVTADIPATDEETPINEDPGASPAQSEVVRRINLLGKLIIPPSAP